MLLAYRQSSLPDVFLRDIAMRCTSIHYRFGWDSVAFHCKFSIEHHFRAVATESIDITRVKSVWTTSCNWQASVRRCPAMPCTNGKFRCSGGIPWEYPIVSQMVGKKFPTDTYGNFGCSRQSLENISMICQTHLQLGVTHQIPTKRPNMFQEFSLHSLTHT